MVFQIEVGPWVGDSGLNPWTFIPDGKIVGFRIASGVVIDSIRFTYEDNNQVSHHSPTYGGDGGTLKSEVKFDDDEYLSRVSGTIGNFNGNRVITSLSIHTNKRNTYGPYGGGDGTSFFLPVPNSKYIGFFGSFGDYLDAIGIIARKIASQVEVGPWGGDGGVNPWTFKPVGTIVGFCIASGGFIDSIRFTYKDDSQVSHNSPTYGGDGGTLRPEVKFDDDEYLIRVSGTFGKFYNYTMITSLSFHTNKGHKYGSYGEGGGTSFSLPVSRGRFIGFFGNYGRYLDSLGFILDDPVKSFA